jgi:hypothetical protein
MFESEIHSTFFLCFFLPPVHWLITKRPMPELSVRAPLSGKPNSQLRVSGLEPGATAQRQFIPSVPIFHALSFPQRSKKNTQM